MSSFKVRRIALAMTAISSLAAGACQLSNAGGAGRVETHATLCASGRGQLDLRNGRPAVDVPAPGSSSIDAGYAGGAAFYIYDNTCTVQGEYTTCSGGIPYIIEENFLADVLTISATNMGVGSADFSFYFGDGNFSIGNNGSTCQNDSSGLSGGEGCKCAFPQDGTV